MTSIAGSSFIHRWLRVAKSAVLVEAGLRTRSLPELTSALGITFAPDQPSPAETDLETISAQVRWACRAADRMVRLLPGGSPCLRRALIAGHLLRKHKPSLRIGSARLAGQFAFHAWLEVGGQVAADPTAASFRPLVRARPAD
ncbi:MAG TPA: lasso peptide biosynthesis B2 protein [Polyangiaceae bacterium]|nr:lasso peptide biosynthesis B2 protein [Polyangiaceae bacterium]